MITTRTASPAGGFPSGDPTARVQAALTGVLNDAMAAVVSQAQANASVKTGAMRRSVRVEEAAHRNGAGLEGTVAAGGSGAPYAAAQEFGSGLYGERAAKYPIVPVRAKVLAWPLAGQGGLLRLSGAARSGANVSYAFAKRVMHPGVRPQRYVGRAIDTVWPSVRQKAIEAVAAVFGGGA